MRALKTSVVGAIAVTVCMVLGLTAITRLVDPRAWYAETLVWSLNHRVISVDQMDWGHLKLRSGPYGIAALKRLKRKGSSFEVRMMASAALNHYTDEDYQCEDIHCDRKSDFDAFKPSRDVLNYMTDLPEGQTLPESFLIDAAFGLNRTCRPPLDKKRSEFCVIRMQDFNFDSRPEVYVELFYRSND